MGQALSWGVSWLKMIYRWHQSMYFILDSVYGLCDVVQTTFDMHHIYSISCMYFKHANLQKYISWRCGAWDEHCKCYAIPSYTNSVFSFGSGHISKSLTRTCLYWANPYLSTCLQECEWFLYERLALTPVYNYIDKTISIWQWHRKDPIPEN